MSPRSNHYRFLQVEESASREEIESAVKRLSNEANSSARSSPKRSQEIRKRLPQIKRDLLSSDSQRQAYNRRILLKDEPEAGDSPATAQRDELVPKPARGSKSGLSPGTRVGVVRERPLPPAKAVAEPKAKAPATLPSRPPAPLMTGFAAQLRSSLWMGWTVAGPTLSWISFMWIGMRARKRPWIILGVLFFVCNSALLLWAISYTANNDSVPTVISVLSLSLWMASILAAVLLRKQYLPYSEGMERLTVSINARLRQDRRYIIPFVMAALGSFILLTDRVAGAPPDPRLAGPLLQAVLADAAQLAVGAYSDPLPDALAQGVLQVASFFVFFCAVLGITFLLTNRIRLLWMPGVAALIATVWLAIYLAKSNLHAIGWQLIIAGASALIIASVLPRLLGLPEDEQTAVA